RCENAGKGAPPGGRVQARVTAQPAGAAQVQVIDSGIGIATADLPHVFERFYRADKARRSGGNGLGLALARRVIELHEGQITVTSEPGSGTTFTVDLPAFTSS